jgi:hypothetical protein
MQCTFCVFEKSADAFKSLVTLVQEPATMKGQLLKQYLKDTFIVGGA